MSTLSNKIAGFRDTWIRLNTGRSEQADLDEEQYRQRILATTSLLWLTIVIALTIITPLLLDLSPKGRLAATMLFIATGVGVLVSMLVLRYLNNRIAAMHLLLLVYTGAFTLACAYFGGTKSPTYALLILAPAMAGIVGSIRATLFWSLLVLLIWVTYLCLERIGIPFPQIIKPQNYNIAITLAYGAMGAALIGIIVAYAELNKRLRDSLTSVNRELEFLSAHDALTGLPNRRSYDERLTLSLARAKRQGEKVGLLMFDLNGFKAINDTHGHSTGDWLLKEVAQRLKSSVREIDLVARLGGDEFAVVADNIKSNKDLAVIALKLQKAIEQPARVNNQELSFGASFGVAIYPDHATEQTELEELADKAMYRAKKAGSNTACAGSDH